MDRIQRDLRFVLQNHRGRFLINCWSSASPKLGKVLSMLHFIWSHHREFCVCAILSFARDSLAIQPPTRCLVATLSMSVPTLAELSLSWLIALPISPQTVEYLSWEWLKVWWMASPCHSNWRFWLVLALAACPWNVCLSNLVGVCGGRCFVLLVVGKSPFCCNQLTPWISFFHWSCLAISTGERDFVRRSRPLNR